MNAPVIVPGSTPLRCKGPAIVMEILQKFQKKNFRKISEKIRPTTKPTLRREQDHQEEYLYFTFFRELCVFSMLE